MVTARREAPTPAPSALMTTQEVADLLRCSLSKLKRQRADGNGPRWTRNGRTVLYYRASVLLHLKTGGRER